MLALRGEKGFFDDVKKGVDIALNRLLEDNDVELDVENDVDPIKLNKFTYFVIQDVEGVEGITYGWYKYGAEPDFGKKQYDDYIEDPNPRPADDIPASSRSFVNPSFPSPEEIADYLLDDQDWFEHIVTTPTKEFLVEYYERHAPREPENFGELYQESAKLQMALDDIGEDPGWKDDYEKANMLHDEIDKRMRSTHQAMLDLATTKEAIDDFWDYYRVLDEVLIAAIEDDNWTEEKQYFMRDLVSFYYSYAWKYPALLMSKATATGTHADQLRDSIGYELSNMRGQYGTELQDLVEDAIDLGLYREDLEEPEYSSYGNNEDSSAHVEKWSRAGFEAIAKNRNVEDRENSV